MSVNGFTESLASFAPCGTRSLTEPSKEIGFTVFFMGELLIKIGFTSARSHFFGSDWAWNLFDALIVLLALFNLVVEFGLTMWVLDASTLTIARVIRLTRLTRLRVTFLRLRARHRATVFVPCCNGVFTKPHSRGPCLVKCHGQTS